MNNKQLAELKLMQEYASKRGGKCLATEYINSHTKYLWEDSEGNQWYAPWYSLKQRNSWSMASGIKSKKQKLIQYTIEILNSYAESKGGKCLSPEYKGIREFHLWQDSEGNEFSMRWMNVLAGQWSPFEKSKTIGKLKRKYTTEEFRDYCKSEYNVEFLSEEYKGINHSYLFRDSQGIEFTKTWSTVVRTGRLQKSPSSLPESEIAQFLESLGVQFERNNRQVLNGKELDFFIPSLGLAIEFHGLKWHCYESVGNLHRKKYENCKDLGIRLIQIFEHEWKNRRNMVKSFIKSAVKSNTSKVDARKCKIIELNKQKATSILNDTHIQGSGRFDKCFALEYKGEPVMLITIGKHHRGPNNVPVLTRCVALNGTTVRGGLSRLCKFAYSQVGKMVTWVDLRWSTGEAWERCGWKIEQELSPDYFYYNENTKEVISKQSRKKSNVGTPDGMTERQHAKLDGLKVIKDAGKIRMVYKV